MATKYIYDDNAKVVPVETGGGQQMSQKQQFYPTMGGGQPSVVANTGTGVQQQNVSDKQKNYPSSQQGGANNAGAGAQGNGGTQNGGAEAQAVQPKANAWARPMAQTTKPVTSTVGDTFYDQYRMDKGIGTTSDSSVVMKEGITAPVTTRVTTQTPNGNVMHMGSNAGVQNNKMAMEQNLGIPVDAGPGSNYEDKNGVVEYKNNNTYQPYASQVKDTRSDYQKFRDSLFDEEKMRRESDRKAKIMAIGDALRHMGNLYYTTQGASPQNYGTESPAMKERLTYEQGYAQREAVAQKRYAAELAAEKAKVDAAREAALANSKISYQTAQTNKILQDMGIQAEKYPYEMQEIAAKAAEHIAKGEKAKYDAEIARLTALNTPEALTLANDLKKAQKKHYDDTGKAALQNAATARMNANTNKEVAKARIGVLKAQKDKIINGENFEIPTTDPSKNYVIRKENATALNNALRGIARSKSGSDAWNVVDDNSNSYIIAAYEHLDDPDVVSLLERYSHGKKVDTGRGSHKL